jgi:hypothetical protein
MCVNLNQFKYLILHAVFFSIIIDFTTILETFYNVLEFMGRECFTWFFCIPIRLLSRIIAIATNHRKPQNCKSCYRGETCVTCKKGDVRNFYIRDYTYFSLCIKLPLKKICYSAKKGYFH